MSSYLDYDAFGDRWATWCATCHQVVVRPDDHTCPTEDTAPQGEK